MLTMTTVVAIYSVWRGNFLGVNGTFGSHVSSASLIIQMCSPMQSANLSIPSTVGYRPIISFTTLLHPFAVVKDILNMHCFIFHKYLNSGYVGSFRGRTLAAVRML